jgi:hypothetical protein
VVMRLYGWSYEQAESFVNDSLVVWRQLDFPADDH